MYFVLLFVNRQFVLSAKSRSLQTTESAQGLRKHGFMEWKRPILTFGIRWSNNCRHKSIYRAGSGTVQHCASCKHIQCKVSTAVWRPWNRIMLRRWDRFIHRTDDSCIDEVRWKIIWIEFATSAWKRRQWCQLELLQLS